MVDSEKTRGDIETNKGRIIAVYVGSINKWLKIEQLLLVCKSIFFYTCVNYQRSKLMYYTVLIPYLHK